MRVRILAVVAVLAILAGACTTVPAGAIATVNGQPIPYEQFERIVAAQASHVGLAARDAALVQRAFDAGIVDRAALDAVLLADLSQPPGQGQIQPGPPLVVPDELADQLFEQLIGGQQDAAEAASALGVTPERLREVFDRLVAFEARGLLLGGGQPGFPIDRMDRVAQVQQTIIQQLVQAEIARQAVAQLDLAINDETVQQIEAGLLGQFEDEQALEAALADVGYTSDDLRELVILDQARRQAIQAAPDQQAVQAFFTSLDVDVVSRFGRWDAEQNQVVAPVAAA